MAERGAGFTRVDNDVLEAMMSFAGFNTPSRVVLAVLRHSIGYNRLDAELTVRDLVDLTGVGLRNVQIACRALVAGGVLIQPNSATFALAAPQAWRRALGRKSRAQAGSDPGIVGDPRIAKPRSGDHRIHDPRIANPRSSDRALIRRSKTEKDRKTEKDSARSRGSEMRELIPVTEL